VLLKKKYKVKHRKELKVNDSLFRVRIINSDVSFYAIVSSEHIYDNPITNMEKHFSQIKKKKKDPFYGKQNTKKKKKKRLEFH
jgi:hypothetical protein